MHLEGEHIRKIQQFLKFRNLMIGAVTEKWTAPACEGYKQYQLSIGVQYPKCTLLPTTINDVSKELQALLNGEAPSEPVVQESAPVVVEEAPVDIPLVKEVAPKVETAIRIPKKKR